MKRMPSSLLRLLFVSTLILCGCSPKAGEGVTPPDLNWDDISTLVLMAEGPQPEYFLFEGEAANEVVEAFKENTEITAGLGGTQTVGATILICAISQDGSPKYRIVLDYQFVEGMGGKRDPYWEKGLLEGQARKRKSVLEVITTKGVEIPPERFEEHYRDFEQMDRTWLWWKN